jgi:hypothetical protein
MAENQAQKIALRSAALPVQVLIRQKSRIEPRNGSRRRKEAEGAAVQDNPPRYLGGYNTGFGNIYSTKQYQREFSQKKVG